MYASVCLEPRVSVGWWGMRKDGKGPPRYFRLPALENCLWPGPPNPESGFSYIFLT